MTDEYLIAMLRNNVGVSEAACRAAKAAADRIEQLVVEKDAATAAAYEVAAYVAINACLVPPDGGSPTEEERLVCEEAYRRILSLIGEKK